MASAGMGDVLSGLIGSLIVQGSHYNLDPWKATFFTDPLHSLAADILVKDGIGPIGQQIFGRTRTLEVGEDRCRGYGDGVE